LLSILCSKWQTLLPAKTVAAELAIHLTSQPQVAGHIYMPLQGMEPPAEEAGEAEEVEDHEDPMTSPSGWVAQPVATSPTCW